jgi:hypothetical protein
MLIYYERKILLNGWRISADKDKQTGCQFVDTDPDPLDTKKVDRSTGRTGALPLKDYPGGRDSRQLILAVNVANLSSAAHPKTGRYTA